MPGYHLPCFTAAASDIPEGHGLRLEIVDPEPGPENVRAVAAGRYDFCLTSVAHFLGAKRDEPELPVKFVFMVARRTHMAAFVVEGRRAAHGRPVETLQDLDGTVLLGAANSPFVREYLSLARALGIEVRDIVEMPYERLMEALAEGKGDVAVTIQVLSGAEPAAVGGE